MDQHLTCELADNAEYLFVYGTLRKAFQLEVANVLQTHAEYVGLGRIAGRLYDVGSYPGVTLSDDSSDVVVGEIYKLIEPKIVYAQLDAYEGISTPPHAADEYVKQNVSLLDEADYIVSVYVYQHATSSLKRVVSGDYLHR